MSDAAQARALEPAAGKPRTGFEMWVPGHHQHMADRDARLMNARKCLKFVQAIHPFRDVIDFGCGIGAWLQAAADLGATTVVGVEGEWIRDTPTLIEKELITVADLATAPPRYQKQFDLAITIEVAEHLPESAANGFCDSLVSASDCILFSAAIPGQGGVGHVNEQPLPYWVKKFWQHGYVPVEAIRPFIAPDRTVYLWLRQNLVMFVNYDLLIRSEPLLRHARPLMDFRLAYRHI
jgi:SAM-dependent methyltransferase